jgi:hypothetical protein
LIVCVKLTQPNSVSVRIGHYILGRLVRPSDGASGKYGIHIPWAMMDSVVTVSGHPILVKGLDGTSSGVLGRVQKTPRTRASV